MIRLELELKEKDDRIAELYAEVNSLRAKLAQFVPKQCKVFVSET